MNPDETRGALQYGGGDELASPQPLYGQSWAVVIGIDYDYDGSEHPRLQNARNDAREIAKILETSYAFEHVFLLLDHEATAEAILGWLRQELPQKTEPNDRVVFFFAGHGTSQESHQGVTRGYLVPHGARKDWYADYIDMAELHKACTQVPAKHILIILDCCFSGVNAVASRATPASPPDVVDDAYLKRIASRRTWQILTAGDSDDLAADSGTRPGHSAFTSALLEGLEGGADQNRDGYITATELSNYVTPEVTRQTSGGQSPFFRYLSGSEQGGDFVFVQDEPVDVSPINLSQGDPAQLPRELKRDSEPLPSVPGRNLSDMLRDPMFQGIGAILAFLALLVAIGVWIWPNILPPPPATPTPTASRTPTIVAGVPLNFRFQVKAKSDEPFSEGIDGGEYRSGDDLLFYFTPAEDGYAYLFSLDTKGKFTPLWPDYTSREAAPVKAGFEYATDVFRLDQSAGPEQFFAIASSEPFHYDEDIEPYLESQPLPGGKGVDPVLKRLELPAGKLAQKRITFTHVDE